MPEEPTSPPTPKPDAAAKPEGWEKLRREGDPAGPAEVGYDARRHKPYHVNSRGEVLYQEPPAGFRYNAQGELIAKGE